jgi:hypothetical protein
MARIVKIERKTKERNNIHNIVPAIYCVFEKDGNKYFQIDTYGNRYRDNSEEPDQMIQFDKETAEKLINLIKTEMSIS